MECDVCDPGIAEKRVDKLSIRHAVVLILECGCVHPLLDKRILVCCQLSFPAGSTDNHALTDLLCVAHERSITRHVSKGTFFQEIDHVARLLKFDRQEVRGGDVNAFCEHATRVGATARDLIDPEVETGRIRLTIQEINVMLPDVE